MPKRNGLFVPMETLPLEERLAMDKEWQRHWYKHLAALATGYTVLDVGCGTGYGLGILREAGVVADGFDVVALNDDVQPGAIEDFDDRSWDYVCAIDVIEHIQADVDFLRHLLRVARTAVFLATPNWNVSKAVNAHHCREYTPDELRLLIGSFGFTQPLIDHRIWVSNHELVITTRERFENDETWHNYGVLLEKTKRAG